MFRWVGSGDFAGAYWVNAGFFPVFGVTPVYGRDVQIACAMGTQASAMHLSAAARAGGSRWSDALLGRVYQTLAGTGFRVQVVPQCGFLHFGTTRQLITSGLDLLSRGQGIARGESCLEANNEQAAGAGVGGTNSWVEGCRIGAKVDLAGWNVVVGLDIDKPLALPGGACLDAPGGKARDGRDVWFVRCCGVGDTFKDSLDAGATFCGLPMGQWLAAVGAGPQDVWDAATPAAQRTLWTARVFPATEAATGYRRRLWMYDPAAASDEQHRARARRTATAPPRSPTWPTRTPSTAAGGKSSPRRFAARRGGCSAAAADSPPPSWPIRSGTHATPPPARGNCLPRPSGTPARGPPSPAWRH